MQKFLLANYLTFILKIKYFIDICTYILRACPSGMCRADIFYKNRQKDNTLC